ncbi:putative proline-specific permease put4 [Cyberlindnera fabianii]|uniref:Putative proline-specific permease put4 n=1 Tax=Cyberlindnera fabianii TaxID=36022 RepID=A0A1V2L9E9_CYBFA|nr:putative proline-specific permease put4 [Cyberlindnera fabianii]
MSNPYEAQAGGTMDIKSNSTASHIDEKKGFGGEKAFDQDVEVMEVESITIMDEDEERVFGEDRKRLDNSLKQRHLQMIALVTTIGTGIFLSSGGVLATAGPLGCFMAYAIVAFVVGLNQIALAECATLMPTTSATLRHAEQFIDPAWGFAYGWVSIWSAVMPGEISAAAVIVSYWSDLSQAIWITIIIVLIAFANSLNIKHYGEIEFVFAMIKITLLIGLMITSLVITCGGGPNHESIGFRYWRDPGPFVQYMGIPGSLGRFTGFWKALMGSVYSFGGLQGVPSLAAEVKYPRKTIFTACKRVFYRVSFLMCGAAFFLGLIVPSNNKAIATSSGNASSSPFVVAMENANIKVLPHIVNAAVLTSAFSAGNQAVVHGTRLLFALAVKGQAPKVFLKTNRWGVPWVGNIFVCAFMPLAYMNCSEAAANVFGWFQSLSSAKTLFEWMIISANHICMTRAMKAQGIPRSRLPHSIKFAPQAAWISGSLSFLFLLTGGFKNFIHGEFLFSSFFSSYFVIPFALVLYFGWKFTKKTKMWAPHEVELEVLFKDAEDHPEPPNKPLRGWRILTLMWS